MMKFDILTLFPEVFSDILNSSILKNASEKGILQFNYINIRDFTNDKHKRVDDYPYGGGAGMLIKTQPVYDAYRYVLDNSAKRPKTVYLSPRGKVFNQEIAKELSKEEHIVLICGHYEGIDQRIIDEICDFELSIGDFVLTGGELAAMVVCDSVSRLVPGVLSGEESYSCESHYDGMLEFPQYTRPPVYHNVEVPEILLSGNDKNIVKWREDRAYEITAKIRPDLIKEKKELEESIKSNLLYTLYYFGNNEKNLSAIELQLKKNGLMPEKIVVDEESNEKVNNAVAIFDNSEYVTLNADNLICVKLNDITEFETINYNEFKNMTNTDVNGVFELINRFLIKIEIERNGEIPQRFGKKNIMKITGRLPVDLYENHKNKFENISYGDIFTIELESKADYGEYSFDVPNTFSFNLMKIKSKKIGEKTVITSKGLENYIKNNVADCNHVKIIKGNFMKFAK